MSQHDLFTSLTETNFTEQVIELEHARLTYIDNFIDSGKADRLLRILSEELNWQQPTIVIAGRSIPIPRKQVWFGDEGFSYRYSGKTFTAEPWQPDLFHLKSTISEHFGVKFNSALCNLYRDGKDSVAWHADDEPELGSKPIIASFSLGETRRFSLKPKSKQSTEKILHLPLKHNSLVLMGPETQEHYVHQVPKTQLAVNERINITFRQVKT